MKYIYSYIISYFTITSILVYGLNIPALITGNESLVHEYYVKNYKFNLLFDLFLIFGYLVISNYFISYFSVKDISMQLLITLMTTVVISGIFCMYFILQPRTQSFFSRWFHTVKEKHLYYDIVLVGSIFLLSKALINKLNK